MPYALNLTLDTSAALAIERVSASLAALGVREQDLVTQYGPCVTILIVGDTVHPDDILETVRRHVPRTEAFVASLNEPCVIHGTPPTLGLRVSPTDALLALHNAIYRSIPEPAVYLHYRPAHWQPHLKLANVSADMTVANSIATALAETWRAVDATWIAMEIMRYPPRGGNLASAISFSANRRGCEPPRVCRYEMRG